MLNLTNTDERIIALMKKGAKLVYRMRGGHPEFPAWVTGCQLEYNGQQLRLEKATADRICKRDDIRSGYAGYRSDYATSWREMYEHKDTPVPCWISEQWETPVERISTYNA